MPSRFIRAPHPKTEIQPTAAAIQKVLDAGWVGQLKIHGHRVQLHVPADPRQAILAYNRQGQLHAKDLPAPMVSELRRLLTPAKDWNVVEGEWLKPKDKIYLFDYLQHEGKTLSRLPFAERWKQLPRAYISPFVQTLPLLMQLDRCLEVFGREEEDVEGLVFKSPSPGFADTSIIRCRK